MQCIVNYSFKRRPPVLKESNPPAKDQVKLRIAKPKPAEESPSLEHVTISTERAAHIVPDQPPAPEIEKTLVAADQVQLRQAFKPKAGVVNEPTRIEEKALKETPSVVKTLVEISLFKIYWYISEMMN
jgi:hypothetical protein